jgi:hypothetical protein
MSLSLIKIVATAGFVVTLGCTVSKSLAQTHNSEVLFVCEHGNVKSLMAASYFNQLLRSAGCVTGQYLGALLRTQAPYRPRLFKVWPATAST